MESFALVYLPLRTLAKSGELHKILKIYGSMWLNPPNCCPGMVDWSMSRHSPKSDGYSTSPANLAKSGELHKIIKTSHRCRRTRRDRRSNRRAIRRSHQAAILIATLENWSNDIGSLDREIRSQQRSCTPKGWKCSFRIRERLYRTDALLRSCSNLATFLFCVRAPLLSWKPKHCL